MTAAFADLPIERDRDLFLRELLRELSGVLQDVVGMEDAAGFVSVVGSRLGAVMNEEYRTGLGLERLDVHQVAEALVDLKARIGGDFYVEHVSEDEIVLRNNKCPFGKHVDGRPSLCMMTSNVFGRVVAENLGYARINIEEGIARGDAGCKVRIALKPLSDMEDTDDDARSYFKSA